MACVLTVSTHRLPHEPQFSMSQSKSQSSSTDPSQSLSSVSHTSGTGPTSPTQETEPPTQCSVPVEHSPVEMPHEAPPPGSPSSTVPSQSLSRPSHTSAVGPT